MKLKPVMKIVVFAPLDHADKLRKAMGDAGAGHIENYEYCTWSTAGTGRFVPMAGAHPALGEVGKLEEVKEERIETVCEEEKLEAVLAAIRANHPYEAPAVDVYRVEII